ncbi:MAG: signal peptidase I [Clostridia bacterium]|nr:signal peptidase I [Clostridia bacterium]
MKLDYISNEGKILEKKSQKFNRILSSFLLYAVVLIVITFMIWGFYHEVKVVSGESMQPTINSSYSKNNGGFDIVLMNKTKNFQKQDIVIIDFSDYQDELIIKRVIATSGDSIKIIAENNKSVVYLKKANENEWKKLNEDYVDNQNNNTNCAITFSRRSENGYSWSGYTENNDNSYSRATDAGINVSEKMFKQYYVKTKDDFQLAPSYDERYEYYIKNNDETYQKTNVTEEMLYDYYIQIGNTYQKATEYKAGKTYYIKNNDGSIKISEGYFFALGDNRANSKDSSEVGPLKNTKVKGIVETLVPDGTFLNKILSKLLNLKLAK